MEHEFKGVNDFVVVVELEHGAGEGFNVDVGFFEFDVAVEVAEVLGFHVHTAEYGDEPEDSELFIGFVSVVIDSEFLL